MVKCFTKGRLGNVCFELATCYAYSLDHDMPFTISNTTKDPVMQPLYFQNLVNPNWDEAKPAKYIREMQHNYQPLPWEDDWKNYNIQIMGFWQSAKYFQHRRAEVLKLFNIPYEPVDCVSIHIRRGDYTTIPGKHILNTDGYYMATALQLFSDKGYNSFMVFSDDIEWCKEYFKSNYTGHIYLDYSQSNDPLTDIALMSSCKHHIGSSSTFSWWGSWLTRDPESITVTPKQWFQDSQPENCEDIIPGHWIKI